MSIAPLVDALSTLRVAFLRPSILGHYEDITISLPIGAGLRFEQWLAQQAPDWMRSSTEWGRLTLHGGGGAVLKRSVTIGGVCIEWPVAMIDTPDGPKPAPMIEPERVVNLADRR